MIYFIVTILKHKYVVLHMEMYSVDSKNVVIYIYIYNIWVLGGVENRVHTYFLRLAHVHKLHI